jgi:hypothetical protein
MNRTTTHVAVLATLIFGCATTKVGAPATSASVEAVQRENPGSTLVVERLAPPAGNRDVSPQTGRLTLVRTTPTETIVADSRGGTSSQFSMRSADVASLTVTRHGRGALYGAGTGALLAAGLTVLAALTLGPCSSCESDFTRSDAARIVGLSVGIPVFLLSTSVGAIIGARTTYVFE